MNNAKQTLTICQKLWEMIMNEQSEIKYLWNSTRQGQSSSTMKLSEPQMANGESYIESIQVSYKTL